MKETIISREMMQKGNEVSGFCEWEGKKIIEVLLSALTDANFHTLREKITPIINKELKTKYALRG